MTANGPDDREDVDLKRLRTGRVERLRDQLSKRDLAACVLVDPVNIRYATGARNMQVFHARNPARYLFLPAEGPVILFEFRGCHHLANGLETIDEVRPGITVSFAASGPRTERGAGRRRLPTCCARMAVVAVGSASSGSTMRQRRHSPNKAS